MIKMDHPQSVAQAAAANAGAGGGRDPVSAVAQGAPRDWQKICALDEIPQQGARVVKSASGNIAVFRTADDAVFALADKCPHKGGPLSQGIVFGHKVACPLHGWNINLDDGSAVAPDKGCAHSFAVKIEEGVVFLQLAEPYRR
jgi:nitrite reductase (NADH) small subunit